MRCRMHGGGEGGVPLENRNALKHGLHTREAQADRWHIAALLRAGWRAVRRVEGKSG